MDARVGCLALAVLQGIAAADRLMERDANSFQDRQAARVGWGDLQSIQND